MTQRCGDFRLEIEHARHEIIIKIKDKLMHTSGGRRYHLLFDLFLESYEQLIFSRGSVCLKVSNYIPRITMARMLLEYF